MHGVGAQSFRQNLEHRLRWCRSTRRSRPWGYTGEIFTHTLPLGLVMVAAHPAWWPWFAAAVAMRAAAAWATAEYALHDPLTRRRLFLVPLQDLAQFAVWMAGFFGNTILWRGRKYMPLPDGRLGVLPLLVPACAPLTKRATNF